MGIFYNFQSLSEKQYVHLPKEKERILQEKEVEDDKQDKDNFGDDNAENMNLNKISSRITESQRKFEIIGTIKNQEVSVALLVQLRVPIFGRYAFDPNSILPKYHPPPPPQIH